MAEKRGLGSSKMSAQKKREIQSKGGKSSGGNRRGRQSNDAQ
jgi:general stress protein YciG